MKNEMAVDWQFEVFFDGECPLCAREVSVLQRLDRRDTVLFTDISSPHFDATETGRSQDELMASIRGRDSSGRWFEGVEVFRQLYTAVGFGWVVVPTRLPGVSNLLDAGYTLFARNRLRLTGRCSSEACETGEARG